MSFSAPQRYRLFRELGEWSDSFFNELGYVYLSRFPSKEDIIDILRQNNELTEYSESQISDFYIERPNGWDYKTIMIYFDHNKFFCLWKIEPAPIT